MMHTGMTCFENQADISTVLTVIQYIYGVTERWATIRVFIPICKQKAVHDIIACIQHEKKKQKTT